MKRDVFKTLRIRKHSEKVSSQFRRDFCFQFLSSHNLKIGVIVINLKLININNIFNVDNSNIIKVE